VIAADTSTWVAYLEGATEKDAELLRQALSDKQAVMTPVVLTELLSDPKLPSQVAASLADLPLIQTSTGYWQRAGLLRAKCWQRGGGLVWVMRSSLNRVSTKVFPSSHVTVTSGRLPKLRISIWSSNPEPIEPRLSIACG
jgi:hypothetical protein